MIAFIHGDLKSNTDNSTLKDANLEYLHSNNVTGVLPSLENIDKKKMPCVYGKYKF